MKNAMNLKSIVMLSATVTSLTLGLSFTLIPRAHAYYSTLDTGDTLGEKKYDVSLEPQVILNRYDGFNLVGRVDAGINEESNLRAIMGFGKVDFQAGALYKYIPFPDTSHQPAIGFTTGAIYAHVQGSSELNLRFTPLVSKKAKVEDVNLNLFASVPFGVLVRDNTTTIPIQIAAGTEWKIPSNEQFSIMGELGVNVSNAFSYISFAGVYYFDESMIHGK